MMIKAKRELPISATVECDGDVAIHLKQKGHAHKMDESDTFIHPIYNYYNHVNIPIATSTQNAMT